MKSLEESYKVLKFFLRVFTFSTTTRTSRIFKLYRVLILLFFMGMSGYRFYLLLHMVAPPEHLTQRFSLVAIALEILLDFLLTLLMTFGLFLYQILIKNNSLEVFDSLKRIDLILTKTGQFTFNYRRKFLITLTISVFLIALCLMVTYFGGYETKNLLLGMSSKISIFFSFQIFFVLFFIISLCNEVRSRIKCLNLILRVSNMYAEDVSLVMTLASNVMRGIGDHFAVEILVILSKFNW